MLKSDDIKKIIKHIKEHKSVEKLIKAYSDLRMSPIFGYELEFYVNNGNIQEIEKALNLKFQKERGVHQYEIASGLFNSPLELIDSVNFTRFKLTENGANLAPKPFADDFGSSLQLHFNVLNLQGSNMFDDKAIIQFVASGICHFMQETMAAVLLDEVDYARFDSKFKAPTHICYGNNNRTAAIRVPSEKPLRLEHRIFSNLTDVYTAVFIILKSALLGMQNKMVNYSQIFGNAFDAQYNLQPIAKTFEEALESFNPNFFLEETI
jgi:glutamine synthetase